MDDKHLTLKIKNLCVLTISEASQLKTSMKSLKTLSTRSAIIPLFVGLIVSPTAAFAGIFSGDYNPYIGLSPFEQCMIYLGGDENIEQALNEDLFGCGEVWGIEENQ